MTILAGEIVTAGRLQNLQTVTYDAAATGGITLTTSQADLTGATITLTTLTAGALYVVTGEIDFRATTGGDATMQGRLVVDGAAQTREMLLYGITTGTRATVMQHWRGTLPVAGSHTLKLAALKTAANGVMVANSTHSSLVVKIYEVV